jgi:hypothetical protein
VPAERYTNYDIRRLFPDANVEERLPVERMAAASGSAPLGVGY